MVSTSSLKNLQKTERCSFQRLSKFVFQLKVASKPFFRKLRQPHFNFNSLERFASLSQTLVSTSSLKSLQITEKCYFQTITTLVFELKIASKPFSTNIPMTKLWFKWLWMLCLTFPKSGFNFFNEKFAKNRKILFSSTHNTHFWAQGRFKTIF